MSRFTVRDGMGMVREMTVPLPRFPDTPAQGLAKYAHVRNVILRAIEDGHWRPGDQIPTEQDLAEALPFSLGTVQRALRMLVEEGILVRRPGLGSFVAAPRRPMSDPWHLRFLDDAGALLPVFPHVLSRETAPPDGPWMRRLGEARIPFQIVRRIDVGGEFTVFARFYADGARLPALRDAPLRRLDGANLRHMVAEGAGLPMTGIHQTVHLAPVDAEAAAIVGIEAGAMALHLEALAMTGATPLYVQDFVIPPTKRRLLVQD